MTIDDLRSKFAEQRAKGAEHTISEEEEDMLLETLGKWRGRNSGSHSTTDHSADSSFTATTTSDGGNTEESGSNSSTTVKLSGKGSGSTATSSSSQSKPKRYSNNLFGSGRLRDYTYLRSTVTSTSKTSPGGSSKPDSVTQSEDSTTNSRFPNTSSFTDSLASSSPPTGVDESVMSVNIANDQGSEQSASSSANEGVSAAEYRLQKGLGPMGLMKASVALENVIKEIEDEVEEEIVMPRSTPIPRNHVDPPPQQNNGFLQAGHNVSCTLGFHSEMFSYFGFTSGKAVCRCYRR